MRIKLDENIPVQAKELLAAANHSVDTVFDELLNGKSDEVVIEACRHEGRVLFTLDLDFADIRLYPPNQYTGIVVFRPHSGAAPVVLSLLARCLAVIAHDEVRGSLWIVSESGIRIHSPPGE